MKEVTNVVGCLLVVEIPYSNTIAYVTIPLSNIKY